MLGIGVGKTSILFICFDCVADQNRPLVYACCPARIIIGMQVTKVLANQSIA